MKKRCKSKKNLKKKYIYIYTLKYTHTHTYIHTFGTRLINISMKNKSMDKEIKNFHNKVKYQLLNVVSPDNTYLQGKV